MGGMSPGALLTSCPGDLVVLISGKTHGSERPIQGPVTLDLLPVREIPNQQNRGQRMDPFGDSGAVRGIGMKIKLYAGSGTRGMNIPTSKS